MTAPSTPIADALKECTADERTAILARTPPYDGVRTWSDLEAVRAQPTLFDMPVKIDHSLPSDTIELRDKNERVQGKIVNVKR